MLLLLVCHFPLLYNTNDKINELNMIDNGIALAIKASAT